MSLRAWHEGKGTRRLYTDVHNPTVVHYTYSLMPHVRRVLRYMVLHEDRAYAETTGECC